MCLIVFDKALEYIRWNIGINSKMFFSITVTIDRHPLFNFSYITIRRYGYLKFIFCFGVPYLTNRIFKFSNFLLINSKFINPLRIHKQCPPTDLSLFNFFNIKLFFIHKNKMLCSISVSIIKNVRLGWVRLCKVG
jgi:hypothetical protein